MDTKTVLIRTAALFALCNASAAIAATTFLPGLYETRVSYPGQGTSVEVKRECVTTEEARTESLERQLAEAAQDAACTYTQRSIAGGRFNIVANCNASGFRTSVKQTGTYSPTSMTMNMTMTLAPAPGAKPVRMETVMAGRRIAATCPAGTDND